jgi:hypothetical protein
LLLLNLRRRDDVTLGGSEKSSAAAACVVTSRSIERISSSFGDRWAGGNFFVIFAGFRVRSAPEFTARIQIQG